MARHRRYMLLSLRTSLLALFFASVACAGHAGAWARDKGKVFISVSTFSTWPSGRPLELPDVYASTYAEVGLGRRLTAGLDLGTPDYSDPTRMRGTAFLNYTLTQPDSADQLAVHLGGGVDHMDNVMRLGMAYGRGLTLWDMPGWISVEAYGLQKTGSSQRSLQLDATLGISDGPAKYMVQFSAGQDYAGRQSVSITPSYVRNVWKSTHLEIGVAVGLTGKPDPALKLGIWQDF